MARLAPPTESADDSPLFVGPTDEHLVEVCSSGTLRVRHTAGLAIEYLEQHPDCMLGAASSPDRHTWALVFNKKQLAAPEQPPCRIELRGWPFSASSRHVIGEAFGFVHALALSPDATRLAILEKPVNQRELALSLLDVRSGAIAHRATSAAWAAHHGFAWSPDGAFLVVGTRDGHALVDGSSLTALGHLAGPYSSDAAFSPDGSLLALGYWDAGLVLPTPLAPRWFDEAHPSPIVRAV